MPLPLSRQGSNRGVDYRRAQRILSNLFRTLDPSNAMTLQRPPRLSGSTRQIWVSSCVTHGTTYI